MNSTANYKCPHCGGRFVRDNTPKKRFRCDGCGEQIHEAVASNVDVLEDLAGRDDVAGDYAEQLLETGGVS